MKAAGTEKKQRNAAKKAIIVVLCAVCMLIIVFYCIIWAVNRHGNGDETLPNNYTFDYANYDEDIFRDKEYMSYDRNIYYTSINSYMTVTIDRENMDDVSESYRRPILFMMDYIDAIVNGDVETYNSCHASEYYKSGRKPKENFTMQKLYAIKLTTVDTWYDDAGSEALRYYNIGIDYMIKNNNGTLRNDMGSDAIRRIYLTLKETSSGTITITDESYFSCLETAAG